MIEEKLKQYLNYNKYINDSIGFYACRRYYNKLKNFVNRVNDLGKELEGYGYPIEIQIDAVNGGSNIQKLNIKFVPYSDDRNRLVAYWEDDNLYKLYYVIDENYDKDLEAEDENAEHSSMFIPVLSFVFLQIYEKQDSIINNLYIKAFDDINMHMHHEDILKDEFVKINEDKSLHSLVTKLNQKRDKVHNLIGYSADVNFSYELNNFYSEILEFCKKTSEYGNSIKIKINIYDGFGELCEYCLTVSPYKADDSYIDKKDLITGYFINETHEKILDTFIPGYTPDEINDLTKSYDNYYLPVSSHIFIQIYNKRDIIIKMLKTQLLEDIEKRYQFNIKISNI